MGEQVEQLEHHPHLRPQRVQVRVVIGDPHAIHDDLPPIDRLQLVDAPQEGGLSAAAGAEDERHLPPPHVQAHVDQRLHVLEALVDVSDLDDVIVHRS